MGKKYLRKNEFRIDFNIEHTGANKKPHPAYISARKGHKYKANSITHARFANGGQPTIEINENPNKLSIDKRKTRISPPYWQNVNLFGSEKLSNFKFSRKTRKKIKKINKKYK